MYKGKSKTKAIQLYRDQLDVSHTWDDNVIEYVPASKHYQERVTASQIIHTQNVHHHHHYGNRQTVDPEPVQKQVSTQPEKPKTSDEELLIWFGSILGCTFTFGFALALLLKG